MAERRSVYVCQQCKMQIPFGTLREPAATECPTCGRELSIGIIIRKDGEMPPELRKLLFGIK